MEMIVNLGLPLLLLIAGYMIGTYAEKKHYQRIIAREKRATDIILITSKYAPSEMLGGGIVVTGNVVIASDYFKRFVAWLIGIFGGRINVYESLLDRARREAILRMKDQARAMGANLVVNVKFETATLNDIQKRESAMVEVLAYGTAIKMP